MAARRWEGVALVVFCAAAACGDDDGGSTPPDAAPIADGAPSDAAAPLYSWYVMDSTQVPETAGEATMMGLDLDGDEMPDNFFGGLLAALHGQADMPIAGAHMQAVVSGRALTLVGLQGMDVPEEGPVQVRIAPGADLDDDPADNFSGTEPFAVEPLEGAGGELAGSLADEHLRAGPGTVPVLLALGGQPAEVAALRGIGGRIDCRLSEGGLTAGRFGVAFTADEIESRLIPAMAAGIDAILVRDCPDGVCGPDTQGEQLAVYFDDDGDGRVTAEELGASSLVASTLGNPDLDLFDADGDYNPDVDGVNDSLSFGVGFTAVPAVLAE